MVDYEFSPHIPDDTNKLLFQIQIMVFSSEANRVFKNLSRKYVDAANLLGIKPELYLDLMDHKLFNPRPFYFEYIYNHIAAYYRYRRDDHGQIPLPFPGSDTYSEILKEKWLSNFEDYIEYLLSQNNLLPDILSIFLYHDSKEGKSIFERIITIVQREFPLKNSPS